MIPTAERVKYLPRLRPIESLWRRIPMATATLNTRKATSKAARAENKAVLRKRQIQRAAGLLKHVSDPTRLQVILMLAEGEKHVGGICETLNQSQPATSHHLALLRHGGLIAPRRQGKNNFYALTEAGEQLASIVKGVAR
jgi:DNA-binding transcriptional ArsR family regulator